MAAIEDAFPPDFRAVSKELGIDIRKPAELCHFARWKPGPHYTRGWFHLVGRILSVDDAASVWLSGALGTTPFDTIPPGFEFGFGRQLSLVPPVFKTAQVVQLNFGTWIPWVIAEPEPE